AGIEHRRSSVHIRDTKILLNWRLSVDIVLVGITEVTAEGKRMISVVPGDVVGEIPYRVVPGLGKDTAVCRYRRCERSSAIHKRSSYRQKVDAFECVKRVAGLSSLLRIQNSEVGLIDQVWTDGPVHTGCKGGIRRLKTVQLNR